MKKISSRKRIKTARKRTNSIGYFRIVLIASLVLLVALSGKIFSGISKPHVLGASTSTLLADKGSDDSSGTSGGGSGSGGGTNSGSGSSSGGSSSGSSGGSSSDGGSSSGGGISSSPVVSQDTKVDCVGPDGRHFTTSFHDCQELNQKWGKSNFNFTSLSAPSVKPAEQEKPEPSVTPVEQETPKLTGKVEVQTEGNKGELNLESQGIKIEVKREDNGQLTIKAHKEDGQEIELKDDALDGINETLKDQEVEVSTTSANKLAITSHDVAAHTTLPISIDPSTNTLAVTTPDGTKDVAVLPDKAVESLLNNNVLSSVLSQSTTSSSGSATTVIGLTTVNNQPVFEVQGVKQKHLLGVFPVGFQKTVTVSAQTGQILSTQENFINQVLEALSV